VSESIAVGITHYPLLAVGDENMAELLRWTLRDPDIPTELKNPDNWPISMRREWGADEGRTAAAQHRSLLRADLKYCREALDEFEPDLLIVWGDDQYENFREEVVPPFCVLAYPDLEVQAFEHMNELVGPNAWGLPDESTMVVRGEPAEARFLANALIADGFDIAYSYQKRSGSRFPHAIGNTQLFLDYDNAGKTFPYAIVPITVNCYGQHAIVRRGGLARFADIWKEELDPSGPSPKRCFELGAAVARICKASDKRVALIASSSWSHAFLNDKDWHLRPDTAADVRLYEALVRGDYETLKSTTSDEIIAAGQHEMLNWFCMLGAVAELRLTRQWSALRCTDVFNSNKCFAVYR
jgi:Catalytic LigB subunit of aromatic ring-opening dioxygenase